MRAVRAQAALVRSLLDELESIAPPSGSSPLGDAVAAQVVEELTQLAFRMMDAALSIAPHRVVDLCLQHGPAHASAPGNGAASGNGAGPTHHEP
jgi:hypothetical protein